MAQLTCPTCGNTTRWRNARQDRGRQSATCIPCGERVESGGNVELVDDKGGMWQVMHIGGRHHRR